MIKGWSMRVTEKIFIKNNQEKNKNGRNYDGEETMAYDVRKRKRDINDSSGHVFSGNMQTGINTGKSIFDKTAIFRTNKGKMG